MHLVDVLHHTHSLHFTLTQPHPAPSKNAPNHSSRLHRHSCSASSSWVLRTTTRLCPRTTKHPRAPFPKPAPKKIKKTKNKGKKKTKKKNRRTRTSQEALICVFFVWARPNRCVRWPAWTRSCPGSGGLPTSPAGHLWREPLRVMPSYFDSYGARNRWYASFFNRITSFSKFVFQKFLHECAVATVITFCAVLVSLRASLYSASWAFFLA